MSDSERTKGNVESYLHTGLPLSLEQLLKTGKIPNALLLTGPGDSGKESVAGLFSQAANCREKDEGSALACGKCRSCKKIIQGMHPDMLHLMPVKEKIRIGRVRELISELSVKPHEADLRVVHVHQAQAMNPEAANAILKILEEPPSRTCFILTANHLTDLLPTIISRCMHVRLSPPSGNTIRRILMDEHGVDEKNAQVAAAMADGSLTTALKLINMTDDGIDRKKRRLWLMKGISALIMEELPNSVLAALSLAESLAMEPELIKESLAMVRTFIRDLAVLRFNPKAVINRDLVPLLQKCAGKLQFDSTFQWICNLHDTEKKIASHTNARLTLEVFFLELAAPSHKGTAH